MSCVFNSSRIKSLIDRVLNPVVMSDEFFAKKFLYFGVLGSFLNFVDFKVSFP
jgi:hypothetical protein